MKSLKPIFTSGLFLVCLFISIDDGYANVTELGGLGAKGLGMASAITADPDNLISAFYYNPAGLNELRGQNAVIGTQIGCIRIMYKNSQGYVRRNYEPDALMPYCGYSTDHVKPVVLGIGMYSTLGVGFNFTKDPARGIPGNIESAGGVLCISPAIACRINQKMSVGLELNIGYGLSEMFLPTPAGYLETEADGFGYGATLGLLYELTPSLTAGLNWRSPMKTGLEGTANLDGGSDGFGLDYYWPQMISFGLAYKPIPELTFGFTAKWSDWTYFDQSKFCFQQLKFLDGPLVQDSRDTMKYSVGVEYWFHRNIVWYVGGLYDQYSIDSKWVSPALPDASSYQVCSGMGFKWNSWQVDLYFDQTFISKRTIESSLVGYPGAEISGKALVVGCEISYNFGSSSS
jgi:long-chain fatty acid transport protein